MRIIDFEHRYQHEFKRISELHGHGPHHHIDDHSR